jgi:hypothetical protein
MERSRIIMSRPSFLIISFALLTAFLSETMAAEPNLVGYWPLDEGSGKEAKDASGNGNNGEFVGDPQWVDGKYGKAVEFNGTSDYIEVLDADPISMDTDVTCAAWFRPSITIDSANGSAYRLMSKNNDYFLLFNYTNIGNLGWLVKDPGGTNHVVHSTTASWTEGEWYHVAGTYDGNELIIYINGILEGRLPYIGEIGTSGLALWIGADDIPHYFPGAIDEVRIYNKPLDEAAINTMMSGPVAVDSTGKLAVTWGEMRRF